MKKSSVAFLIAVLLIGGYLAYDSELTKTLFQGMFSEDLKIIRSHALSFMEDIQFKDFDKAASYHSPEDRKKVNIPKLIERVFKIKPELLDIMEFSIMDATLDSSRERGRVKMTAKVHLLNSDKIKNPELIFYFHKKNGDWYMELESSLK